AVRRRSSLLGAKGIYDEAENLCRRALAIFEKIHGPAHPEVSSTLHNLAKLLATQGIHSHAKDLFQRSIEIDEGFLGPKHHKVGLGLGRLALSLYYQ
ncbi:unnamed protein product, partial [Ectocarpus sp. 12 AP-2014]